jgi:hypothetical protein
MTSAVMVGLTNEVFSPDPNRRAIDPMTTSLSAPSRSRWRRRLLRAFLVMVILAVAVGGYLFVITRLANRELDEVIAELDRTDPGWRWEELEANRATYPEGANSAIQVMAVMTRLPGAWQNPQLNLDLEPPLELTESQTQALTAELSRLGPALTEARKLKDLPHGRYPSAAPVMNGLPGLFDHMQDARTITNLLAHDALLRAQQNDADGAVQSCQAMLNAARSIGDEPTLIALLVRIACRMVALHKLERVLAQGQPSAAILAELQALVEDEEAQPLLLVAARGERAFCDNSVQLLKSDKPKPSQLRGTGPLGGYKIGPIDLEDLFSPILIGSMVRNHIALLQYLTGFVAIAKLPLEEQTQRIQALEGGLPSQPTLVRQLAPAVSKVVEAYRRNQAQVRCALVMLAVERYRLKHQGWPDTLEALVTDKLLTKVPTDPYDGAPLRFTRVDDGVVIYSVGPDGKDDGGKINRQNPTAAGTDLGYQLWDVAKRRQPNKP